MTEKSSFGTVRINPLYVPKSDVKTTPTKSEGLEKAKTFTLDTGTVTLGTGTDAPKGNTSLGKKFLNWISDIGRAIANAFDPAVAREKKFAGITGLPEGMKVDGKGQIDHKAPIKLNDNALKSVGLSDNPQPTTGLEFLKAQAEPYLDANRDVKLPNGGTLALNSEVCRDFGRMDIEIPTDDGPYISSEHGQEAESKLSETAGHLRDFAGSDKTAQVLTSFTNQYPIRNMIRVQVDDQGLAMFPRMANSRSPITVDLPDGTKYQSNEAPQISDAHIKLSKTPEGHFKIDIEWPTYITGFTSSDNGNTSNAPIKLQDGHVIRQTVTASIILDGDSAANGEINILSTDQPVVHYEGKIDAKRTAKDL